MKFIAFILRFCLLLLVIGPIFAQNLKPTKAQQRDKDLATKFTKREVIRDDTVFLLRAPVASINSSQKYFIEALQIRLDKLNYKVRTNNFSEFKLELRDMRKFIDEIATSDNNWPTTTYHAEIGAYERMYHKFVRKDSSTNINVKKIKSDSVEGSILRQRQMSPSPYTPSAGKDIQVGPRGGRYYINKNGKKTYVKKK